MIDYKVGAGSGVNCCTLTVIFHEVFTGAAYNLNVRTAVILNDIVAVTSVYFYIWSWCVDDRIIARASGDRNIFSGVTVYRVVTIYCINYHIVAVRCNVIISVTSIYRDIVAAIFNRVVVCARAYGNIITCIGNNIIAVIAAYRDLWAIIENIIIVCASNHHNKIFSIYQSIVTFGAS